MKPHDSSHERTFDTIEDLSGSLEPGDLAQLLAGPGVTVTNIRYVGGDFAAGLFTGGNNVIGFPSGVILSSGDVNDVVGPNELDGVTTENGQPGDSDLDQLSGFTTFDATVLEFDIVPTAGTLFINYVFASDEYNEYVNSEFNDVFAFFVNGKNCATVNGSPVSINTINNGNPDPGGNPASSNPGLYRNNDLDNGGGSIDTEMDGLTTVLTCQVPVNLNTVNTIKLAIADASDMELDSAVFLSADGITTDDENDCQDCKGVLTINPGDSIKGTVGGSDKTDFFEIDLTSARAGLSQVNISLRELTDNFDLFLFAKGSDTPLASSKASGTADENISRSLESGLYSIEIRPLLDAQGSYTLDYQAGTASGEGALGNISFNGLVSGTIRPAFIQLTSAEVVITAETKGLPDPQVSLKRLTDSSTVATNNNCDVANIATLIGRPLGTPSQDACIVQTLSPGGYFFEVSSAVDSSANGNVLASVTQTPGAEAALLNISYNGIVPAAGIQPAFTVINPDRIVITAEGTGAAGSQLADPQVSLRPLNSATPISFNDDCSDPNIADLIGRPLGSAKDACIVIDELAPGPYVMEVSGVGGGSGNALVSATQVPKTR